MISPDAAIERLRHGPLLVGLDFDGVLAEIVDRPEEAAPVDGARQALATLLARPDVRVAAVSGRRRDDLAARLDPPHGVILVGEHGADFGQALEAPSAEYRLVADSLQRIAVRYPGAWVEEKHAGLTLHGRALAAARADEMAEVAMTELGRLVPGRFDRGNRVVDVRLSGATKGAAVATLRQPGERVLYVGDDTTDETVFEILENQDVGVKVGSGATAAIVRLADPPAVVEFLLDLVAARAG